MPILRYLTAGESHGRCLVAIVEGLPAGLKIDRAVVNNDLARRQQGYCCGSRMRIEPDEVDILSGIRKGETIGSPLALYIPNKYFKVDRLPPVPVQSDTGVGAGILKYDRQDGRDILERASARETAMRVAVGAVCKLLLKEIGVELAGHVVALGPVQANTAGMAFAQILERSEASEVCCADLDAGQKMLATIEEAKAKGDTLGGMFEVVATGLPIGLGSHAQWDRKLDANITQALMSIQAVKGVEIGIGFEGGMSNGQLQIVRAEMKPISTTVKPLPSTDVQTGQEVDATPERFDVCALPAAAIVGEAVVALELAKAMLDKFGGDSISELKRNIASYRAACQQRQVS
ncbi:MAG: chorismate synthase [Verrucomicrobiia bacterium]